jgi:hypothetical protein
MTLYYNNGMQRTSSFVSILLISSAFMLGILVPGGPIETRNFSHIDPVVLGAFNVFLTTLGSASLVIAYLLVRRVRWAALGAALCGVSYAAVYMLDLGHIFPVSPDAMPPLLFFIEIAGAIVAVPLTGLAIFDALRIYTTTGASTATSLSQRNIYTFITILAFVGIGIVIFATNAAMRG